MIEQTLVLRVVGKPPILYTLDGRVVNIKIMADEESNTFVVGRFQRSDDFGGDLAKAGNLQHAGGKAWSMQILHIRQQSRQSSSTDRSQRSVTVYDAPYTAGRVDMLAVDEGVINDILASINGVSNQRAFDHGVIYISEGFATAKALALSLNAAVNHN